MEKKLLLIATIWLIVVVLGCGLYFFREVSPVKEFIDWALGVWPILSVLVVIGIAFTTLVIKHNGRHVKSSDKRDLKQELILSIADFEMQAHRIYHSKSYNVLDYNKACDDLRKQIRIAGFKGDNPVVELYQLRSAIDYKLGNMDGDAGVTLFKHNWQFTSALHIAAISARQWVEKSK